MEKLTHSQRGLARASPSLSSQSPSIPGFSTRILCQPSPRAHFPTRFLGSVWETRRQTLPSSALLGPQTPEGRSGSP